MLAKLSNEQREERNRKERKYRKRKRDEMNNVDISVLSNTPMQLLTISSSMQSDGGNICRDEKFEKQREDRNRKQREYRANGVTQEETIHVQDAKVHTPDDTYVEFDSGLLEPPLIDFVHEDHGETAEIYDIADNVDELDMQFRQSSQGPRNMQFYFYDTEDADALAHRVRRSPDVDLNHVRVNLRILEQNPYAQTFSRFGSMPNIDDYMIELNTNVTPDQGRYNAPTASQVAAISLDVENEVIDNYLDNDNDNDDSSKSGKGSKLTTPDEYDKVICAEILDKAKYPELHRLVIKHMLHEPCGALNKNCACMVDGECRFDFPQQFNQATQRGKDSYPLYRRRDDGWRVKISGAVLDNRWVVPYNPELLMRYNCHINVEACASIKSVKYLYKYVYKGHDCASFSVDSSGEINEIQQYKNARYVTPPEAIYRMLHFPLFGIYPAVLQLQLHLPNMQYVTYDEDGNLENVVNNRSSSRTTLTEYFKMNQVDPEARKLLYKEFPKHYRWITGQNVWQKRKTKRGQVGRVVYAHPREGERYYLGVLLNHVRGATSFEDLRTLSGTTYSTFREACEKRGLVETDKSQDDCLNEASTFQMPSTLRRLFATILVFYEVTDIRALWDNHKAAMSKDYSRGSTNPAAVEQMVLRDIRDLLHSMGKDITKYGLLEIIDIASILPGGRIAHSRFKIPIKIAHNSMCNFKKQNGTAKLLRMASLIIWDEAAMTKRQAVETLDRSLQDIMGCSLPFGGNVIVFGGDFRQVLPVVTRGTRAQIIYATLQRSYLWKNIRKIRLSHNMRALYDPWFSDYLLRIGNGTENTIGDDYVCLPDEIVIGYVDIEDSVNTLIEYVFPSLNDERNTTSVEYMSTRAILLTKNDFVDKLNTKMIDRFHDKEKI
ncbi:Os04g0142700 [Oryza sativa Japonica Group]|uniref:ATP-dependent DNA helicase n=1 Tax=Oryza sativa subsp. japonica TaxID=39947 RepID=C7J1J4_ORYSJ|nr:Os04g0142700 [Oryza sativa Japonica Group]|eukprot:NP_001173748.1 Os04g0142700 [Oryza sativa Japonica Group]